LVVWRCAAFHTARVLQRAAADRPGEVRHHPRLEHVVQDVPGLCGKARLAAAPVEDRAEKPLMRSGA
jgi:hypothetical protein